MSEVVTRKVVIPNPQGLHARPSALIVKCASEYGAEVRVRNQNNGVEADAKRLMEVMMLNAPQGTELMIEAEGDDAPAAVASLAELVERGFDEA